MSKHTQDTAGAAQSANNLRITKERVKAWSACADGYHWFLENFPQGGEFAEVHAALYAAKRYDDASWLVERVFAELDTAGRVAQTVALAGADAEKIAKAAREAATADGVTATTGDGSNAATTGDGSNAATTGYGSNAATTGDGSNAATTGLRSNAATTGDGSNAATTGLRSNAATTGDGSIAAVLGRNSMAKASAGGAIVLVWRAPWPSKNFKIFASKVGENGIKPDVWYQLGEDGAPVEVDEA